MGFLRDFESGLVFSPDFLHLLALECRSRGPPGGLELADSKQEISRNHTCKQILEVGIKDIKLNHTQFIHSLNDKSQGTIICGLLILTENIDPFL